MSKKESRLGKTRGEMEWDFESENGAGEKTKTATFMLTPTIRTQLKKATFEAEASSGWDGINQSMILRQMIRLFCEVPIEYEGVHSEDALYHRIKEGFSSKFCDS